jgi:hypothetical protein
MRTLLIGMAIGLGACATAGEASKTDARAGDASDASAPDGAATPADAAPDDAEPDVPDAAPIDAAVDAPPPIDAAVDAAGAPVLELGAGTDTAQRGAQNGTPFDDACPAGQVLIGFAGSLQAVNGAHGQIAGRCGALSVAAGSGGGFDVRLTDGATLPTRGIGSASPWIRTCAANQVVVGFGGRSGSLLDRLVVRCAPLTLTPSGGGWTVAIGATTDLPAIGGTGGTAFAQTDCATGQIAAVARIRSGDSIDAFGLGCRTPTAR